MSKIKTVVPPANSLLNGLRAIGYSFQTAVADIIDNSITAEAKNISIYSDPLEEEPYFLILDDGYGMTYRELENAMLFGSNRDEKIICEKELGKFGLGLKSASLSQCRKLIVVSKKFRRINAMCIDLNEINESNSWDIIELEQEEIKCLPYIDKLCALESGTIVIWENFDKLMAESGENFEYAFRNAVSETKKHVEYVFHRFYSDIIISFNEKRIDKKDPFLIDSFKAQHGRTTPLPVPGYKKKIYVTPHTLPYANSLSSEEKTLLGNPKNIYDEQGFFLYRNKRLIYWGNWMHMGYKSELNKLARIQIDISSDFDDMWMLDVKKSSAKIPDMIKDKIKFAIEESTIKSKRVIRFRGENEGKSEFPIWSRIRNREGFVKYEINRENPLLKIINEQLEKKDKILLNDLISQIEFYLPKLRIQNDNADSINIINGEKEEIDTDEIINNLINHLSIFPSSKRKAILTILLKSEAYSSVANKKDEILKKME